jgi:hypothetical protein
MSTSLSFIRSNVDTMIAETTPMVTKATAMVTREIRAEESLDSLDAGQSALHGVRMRDTLALVGLPTAVAAVYEVRQNADIDADPVAWRHGPVAAGPDGTVPTPEEGHACDSCHVVRQVLADVPAAPAAEAEAEEKADEAAADPNAVQGLCVYSTLEPCVACVGALLLDSRVRQLVYCVPIALLGSKKTAAHVVNAASILKHSQIQVVGRVCLEEQMEGRRAAAAAAAAAEAADREARLAEEAEPMADGTAAAAPATTGADGAPAAAAGAPAQKGKGSSWFSNLLA